MAREQDKAWRTVRRFIFFLITSILILLFILWRVDNQRVERFRFALIDQIIPNSSFFLSPISKLVKMVSDFQSYSQLYQKNQDLKRELQKMKGWKETALQLEQKNTQLSILNNVKLSPNLSWVTGEVLADSGSPFSKSILLNIGMRDGVKDGYAATDGFGLIGRISGVGEKTSRVLFLTDVSSSIPVVIRTNGERGLVIGDNTQNPILSFIETPKNIKAGMRIVTSGEGKVLPPDLLLGNVALDTDGTLRVILAADFNSLKYLRVLINPDQEIPQEPGKLIIN
ncbi:MAG: rod shape-determining protein MreC [Pseudomonadota bacterium]|nr:rod shape-determining protein MreC [Pseudomonadota bacterium]